MSGNIQKQFHAVSLSGGKDSTAMLLLMIERNMPIDSFFPSAEETCNSGRTERRITSGEIRAQIEYEIMVQRYRRDQLDELVEIMLEVALNRSPTIRIGRDAEYPTYFVQERFRKINALHIEKVMDGIAENRTRVYNTKAYLMAALFNSVSTIEHHFTMQYNADADDYGSL